MSFMANMKGRQALTKHGKGDNEGARALYEQALAAGMYQARYMLSYSVLLIRTDDFQRAKEVLVKCQKAPGITEEQKQQLHMNYAVCCYKLGDMKRAIELLERQDAAKPTGLIYETLGYIYVEAGDFEKAEAFNLRALEYDDEDPICLDNMAQTYYRLGNDKAKAKPYFDKALAIKSTQIDTLYFLAQYDIEAGNNEAAIEKLETSLEGKFSPLNYITPDILKELISSLQA